MECPVCGGTERTVINVRVSRDGELKQAIGSPWYGKNMARCDECGVLYDHRFDDGGAAESPDEKINCPDCGARVAATEATCTYCETPLSED